MHHITLVLMDKQHLMLRLLEALMGIGFLIFILFVVPLTEAGEMVIPLILIPTLLIVDGVLRAMVLKRGIVIDTREGLFIYPKSYRRKSIKLSHITSVYPSKTLHSGAQAGTTTYTYDLNLKGDFGNETVIFSSKEARDKVFHAINTHKKKV